jgi:hypothetical protein
MRKICGDQSFARWFVKVLKDMGKQDRVEQAAVGLGKLLWGVCLEAAVATFLHRGNVVINPDTVAIDEGQAPTNTTTDVKYATRSDATKIPAIGIRNQTFPKRLGSAPQSIGVPGISRLWLFHVCALVA